MNTIVDGLNLLGLGLQIVGVIIVYYAIKNFLFNGGFTSSGFTSSGFTTKGDSALIDKKTNKMVEELSVPDLRRTKFGVIPIVVGLLCQISAIIISRYGLM